MSSPARSLLAADLPQLLGLKAGISTRALFTTAEKVLDFGSVLLSIYVAGGLYYAARHKPAVQCTPSVFLAGAAGFSVLVVFLLERRGGYQLSVSLLGVRETERLLRVTVQAFALILVVSYLCVSPVPRLAFGCAAVTVPVFLSIEKWEMHRLLCTLRSKGCGTRRAVIFGTGAEATRVYSALLRSPKFGINPVAFVSDDPEDVTNEICAPSYGPKQPAKVFHVPLCPELLRQLGASVLVVASSPLHRHTLASTVSRLSESGVDTYFIAGDLVEPGCWMDYANLDDIVLAHIPKGANRWFYQFGKRVLDVAIAASALLALAVLWPVIAIAIKASSSGPIFFCQERVGLGGRRFTMYKFRTMYRDAPEYDYSPGSGDDPRVTRVGRFLRHTSLDELPQLINVLLGQMSLVGPRPEMPFIVEGYSPLQRQRLAAKPGITGLWQISPARAFPIHQHIEYDLYYTRHRSLFMDVAILLHTCLFAPRGV